MTFSRTRLPSLIGIVFLVAMHPGFASGQRLGGAAGIAFPLGSLADTRDMGYRALAFISTSGGLMRVELGAATFPGDEGNEGSTRRRGSWQTASVGVSIRPTLESTEHSRVRAHFGLSAHRTSVPDVSNPYGTVAGAQFGIGFEATRGRLVLSADAGLHSVLSDFGITEFSFAHFIPVTLGISW